MTEKEQNREEIREESEEAEKAEAADKPEEASPDETLGAEIPEENGEENLQAALDEANDK